MRTRRSLSGAGVLLLAAMLLGSVAPAEAQTTAAPEAPTLTSVQPNGYGALLVVWNRGDQDATNAPTGFDVRYEPTDLTTFPGIDDTIVKVSNETTTTISGLKHATNYLIAVRARNGIGNSTWTTTNNEATGLTLTVPMPDEVDDLTLTAMDVGIMAMWEAGDGNGVDPTGYEVQVKTTAATTWKNHAHFGTATSTTITGLMNGTEYSVRVRTLNGFVWAKDQGWSDVVKTMPMAADDPEPEPLDAPMVTVGEPTHNSVMVSWMAVDGATSYTLTYRMDGGRPISVWQDMDMEYTITGLMPDTMYTVWVCADGDDDAHSCSEDESFKTLEGADGTTDPGTTDPGTTDPGTTDPGTTGGDGVAPGAPEKVVLRTATRTDTTITISWGAAGQRHDSACGLPNGGRGGWPSHIYQQHHARAGGRAGAADPQPEARHVVQDPTESAEQGAGLRPVVGLADGHDVGRRHDAARRGDRCRRSFTGRAPPGLYDEDHYDHHGLLGYTGQRR